MRVIEVGDKLISVNFLVKYKSYCDLLVKFWENADASLASDLSDVSSAFLEVYTDSITTVVWTGSVLLNAVTIPLTDIQTTLTWDARPATLVFIRAGHRYAVLSGEVVVQR